MAGCKCPKFHCADRSYRNVGHVCIQLFWIATSWSYTGGIFIYMKISFITNWTFKTFLERLTDLTNTAIDSNFLRLFAENNKIKIPRKRIWLTSIFGDESFTIRWGPGTFSYDSLNSQKFCCGIRIVDNHKQTGIVHIFKDDYLIQ